MRYTILSIVTVAIIVGTAMAQTQDSAKSTTSKQEASKILETISVTQFNFKNVIGYLGHPLGTIVRVTGTVIDGDSTRSRKDHGKTLLKIQTVNGKKLDASVIFEFLRAKRSIQEPKIGTKFDYYVHEYGEFDGIVVPPKVLNIDSPMIAHDGFYYRKQITIHKSMK